MNRKVMASTLKLVKIRLFFYLSVLCFYSPADASNFFPKKSHPTESGYLPINSTTSSAIFFVFYEAQTPVCRLSETPLLVWLQGGPGCSSQLGNFFELGPWRLHYKTNSSKNPVVEPNPGAWNRKFGLLFLDNPIGSGFSIASSPAEIPKNQYTVAKHLIYALKSFISSDPLFKSRPLYITGESYAGKYVPAVGYYIMQQCSELNFKGVAIGNGLTHPVTQVATHAATAYYSGLINEKQRTQLEEIQALAVKLTQEAKWKEATDARNRVLDWLRNATGLATLYDFRRKTPYQTNIVAEFLNKDKVKTVLGVEKSMVWVECSVAVRDALQADVMKSVKFMVEELVKKSKVLLYQGQFDLRDGVVSTEAWVKEMNWEGLESFLMAERNIWRVNGELAGYVQKWGNLSEVVVSGAGHLVPADQAVNSQAMIEDWVLERGLFQDEKRSNSSSNFRGYP
ncbi:serine carboxypeptidase-like 50 [Macadamia integrifolia]|uniref:serine carboxypeptidase-like 50 n=1 Tax=Macadamia integrifolia TaxID=60698 RepID=UPI001C4FE402|nr:serine carboxypeptidase-like 50 [Macadamia integrifolia]